MSEDHLKFRNSMDEESINDRLGRSNDIYRLAAESAGHQSAFTVDKLSWRKLKERLPALIAELAAEVERENERSVDPLA